MDAWRTATITGDLKEVPGIGPATLAKLAETGVYNTYQLFGQYLMLKGEENDSMIDSFEHNERFWFFLKQAGITSHRSAIVKALAEKASLFFPGIYDPNVYEDDDE